MSDGEDERPCIKWRRKKSERGRKMKTKKTEEKIEENKELYKSDGEDGRPVIKWRRRKRTTDTAEEGEKQKRRGRRQKQK